VSEFWGFQGAHIVAMVVIPIVSLICLYQARTFVKRL
jgi:hypothetical protein